MTLERIWELAQQAALVGFALPAMIAGLAGGYIVGTFAWDRLGKTVLGIHMRHWLTRNAPSKFFDVDFVDDRVFVEKTIAAMVERGELRGVRELAR